jgi:hypothetical protein
MKEVRNANLIATVRNALPNAGHLKIATKDGRKASFIFRNVPFFVSSRLIVKEQGFGNKFNGFESEEALKLQERIKATV